MKASVLVVSTLLISALAVVAQPPSGEMRPCSGMPSPHGMGGPAGMFGSSDNPPPMMVNLSELQNLLTEINIDKAVSAKIVSIARAFLKTADEHILKVQKEEIAIKEELLKDKPDMQAISSAITRKSQVFGEIEFAQIKRDLDIKALLSQDEYDRWKSAMMSRMRQLMPDAMDRHSPDGHKAPVQK
jgi:hypothetical protein